MMESPYAIASLPKSFDSEHGSVQATPVYGLSDSRKRKRHEIAVGIDGEGVNIYNVQSQNALTSYAIPPQAYLCCPPCSVYVRRPKPAAAHRQTYLVLRDGPQDTKRRLVCYAEDLGVGGNGDDIPSGPRKHERKLLDGEVCSIDVLAAAGNAAPHLLISYRSGVTDCLSSDLSTLIWRYDERASNDLVEYASLTDAETARRGLFAGREDVVAMLDPATTGTASNTQLLCRVVCSPIGRTLQVYSLRPTAVDSIQSHKSGLSLLASYDLSATSDKVNEQASFEVHPGSGKVYQLLNGKLTVYDLSGTIPRTILNLGSRTDPVLSFTRISTSAVLVVQSDKAVVYETRYGAVQASVSLGRSLAAVGEKRKREEEGQDLPSWALITSFHDLGLIVGLAGNELLALQLSDDLRPSKRGRSDGTQLADVIGKGAAATMAEPSRYKKKMKRWEEWKARVDSAFEGGSQQDVEEVVRATLGIHQQANDSDDEEERGEHADARTVARPSNAKPVNSGGSSRRRVLYLLSRVFRTTSEEEQKHAGLGRLATTVQSDLVYKALAIAGFLTVACVQQAVALYGSNSTVLQPGDMVTAIKDFDGTFEFMYEMLSSSVYWDIEELVQSLRLLVQSLETPVDDETPKLLPAPPPANGDTAMVNGGTEAHIQSELKLAERQLRITVSALNNGVDLRSKTIRLVTDRLVGFPQSSVTKTMRTMMRQEELLFFMKLLRIELLEGSWHQEYIFGAEGEEQNGYAAGAEDWAANDTEIPSNRAIGNISVIMNCAIDAIGMSGWLVGQSGDVYGTNALIQELRSEVEGCLQALHRYNGLGMYLEELQAYDHSVKRMRRAGNEVESMLEEGGALPVGWRAEAAVGVVGGRGGGVKEGRKSVRLLAAEKRSRVGAYAFERIRI